MSDNGSSDQTNNRANRSGRSITQRNWLQITGASSISVLAGCMGGGNGDGTIEYWRWPHSTEPSNTGEDEIVKAFNDGPGAEQGIEVRQVTNPFGDHNQALRTAIGGGDAPALAWTQPANLYDYTDKDRSTIEENAPSPLSKSISTMISKISSTSRSGTGRNSGSKASSVYPLSPVSRPELCTLTLTRGMKPV